MHTTTPPLVVLNPDSAPMPIDEAYRVLAQNQGHHVLDAARTVLMAVNANNQANVQDPQHHTAAGGGLASYYAGAAAATTDALDALESPHRHIDPDAATE